MNSITVPTSSFIPSEEQAAVFAAVQNTSDNIAIAALAGTGKTTTLVEIAKRLPVTASKLFCAFNKDIVGELERRMMGTGVQTKTFHALGLQNLKRHLGTTQLSPEKDKYREIVKAWVERNNLAVSEAIVACAANTPPENRDELIKDLWKEVPNMAVELTNFLRYGLVGWDDPVGLMQTVLEYRLDDDVLNDAGIVGLVINAVPELMSTAEEQTKAAKIDFTDMIYWPVRWNIAMQQFQYVMADECQDISPMQRQMIRKLIAPNGRIFLVGDANQAIYHFTGADCDSFDLSVKQFNATVYPLTVTRRCAQVVVQHAANLVPQFTGLDSKPRGRVVWIDESYMLKVAQPGDIIVCRLKAPLVSAVLDFIGKGIPATILGNEMGKALMNLVDKLAKRRGFSIQNILEILNTYMWEQVERWMKKGDEGMAESVRDQCGALRVIIEAAQEKGMAYSTDAIKVEIGALFSDKDSGSRVTLSTIHKVKGLEAKRVFILRPDKLPLNYPGASPSSVQQERNLDYVARTRAIDTLVYFTNKKFLENAGSVRPPYVQTSMDDNVIEGKFEVVAAPEIMAAADLPQLPAGTTVEPNPFRVTGDLKKDLKDFAALNADSPRDEKPSPLSDLKAATESLSSDDVAPTTTPDIKPIEVAAPTPHARLQALFDTMSVDEIDRMITLLEQAKATKVAQS